MKISILINVVLILVGAASPADWTEEARRIETEQIEIWEMKVSGLKGQPADVRLNELWLGLRNMGHRRTYEGYSEEVDSIYTKLQSEFLSIPGHAQYFADEIKQEQAKVATYPANTGPRVSYDSNRQIAFETLAHIPSPETVKVLGEFLSDERDRHEMTPEETAGQSCLSGGSTGNSTYATKALEKSALRGKPYRPGSVLENDVAKAAWRKWWEGIKAGRETFSFSGQIVEYRFKPDGTWETLSLGRVTKTELGYGSTTETRAERRPQLSPTQETPPGFHIHRFWILFLVGLAGISGLWWALRKKA